MATDQMALEAGFPMPADDAAVADGPAFWRQNARASVGGDWQKLPFSTGWQVRSFGTSPNPGVGWPDGVYVRRVPNGIQIRGAVVPTNSTGYPNLVFTLPAGFRPGWTCGVPTLVNVGTSTKTWETANLEFTPNGNATLSLWDNSKTLSLLTLTTIIPIN